MAQNSVVTVDRTDTPTTGDVPTWDGNKYTPQPSGTVSGTDKELVWLNGSTPNTVSGVTRETSTIRFATNTRPIELGSNATPYAGSGDIRSSRRTKWRMRDDGDTVDYPIIYMYDGGALFIGSTESFGGGTQVGNTSIYATNYIQMGVSSTTYTLMNGGIFNIYAVPLAIGTSNYASAGDIRLVYGATVKSRNSGNGANHTWLHATSDNLYVGGTSTQTEEVSDLYLQCSTAVNFAISSNIPLSVTSTTLKWAATVNSPKLYQDDNPNPASTGYDLTIQAQSSSQSTTVGGSLNLKAGTGTQAYGIMNLLGGMAIGHATRAMANTNQTLSVAESACNIITVTGDNSANRDLTIVTPVTDGNFRIIDNQCTSNGVVIKYSSGTGFTVPAGKNAIVWGNGTNVTGITLSP